MCKVSEIGSPQHHFALKDIPVNKLPVPPIIAVDEHAKVLFKDNKKENEDYMPALTSKLARKGLGQLL
jgi:hypothetical protein